MELTPIIKESFTQYSGAVLQSRALVDVRDCMKPSARQIMYCMKTDKFTADKPFKKTLKAVGSAMRMYIHGDSSCEGVIMRAAQPFSMRYPLVETEGSYGNLMESGNWAAPRYTASRLSKTSDYLFTDIDKNTIEDWRDNYDDTEKYPAVLPSKGYYNICNGTFGIGIGMGSSIPQFNLNEVNDALIKLLNNPNISDDELICMPDFATGALLLNPSEVRESLKIGGGKACQLRAVINHDEKDRCLVVTEIPYGVYTNTICGELEKILEGDKNPGIDRFNDLTGSTPLIKIYLNKGANPTLITNFLYKNTSLQYWYAINMTMLDNGKFPKVYTWRSALQAHIDHEKVVYRRAFIFDRTKAEERLHIVEGLLIALANIEEVVNIIKASSSTSEAANALKKSFLLDDIQVKAILDMKLSRLAHLEVEKFVKEQNDLKAEINRINDILNDEVKFNAQLTLGWTEVKKKFGDKRKTQISEIIENTTDVNTEDIIPSDIVNLMLNSGEILTVEPFDKLQLNKKGSPFAKNTVLFGYKTTTVGLSYLYTLDGKMTKINNNNFTVGTTYSPEPANYIGGCGALNKSFLISVTKNGIIKKSKVEEYSKMKGTLQAVKIKENDELLYLSTANDSDNLLLLGETGGLVKIAVKNITTTGRATIGVKGIDDKCIAATIADNAQLVLTIADGKAKYTAASDFNETAKGAKGQTIASDTTLIATLNSELYVVENGVKLLKCDANMFTVKSKTAGGAKITDSKFIKVIS